MRHDDIDASRTLGPGLTILGAVLTALAAGSAVAAAVHMREAAPLCGPVDLHCMLCALAAASLLASAGVTASGLLLMRMRPSSGQVATPAGPGR